MSNEPDMNVRIAPADTSGDKSVLFVVGGVFALLAVIGAVGGLVGEFFYTADSMVSSVSWVLFGLGLSGTAGSASAAVD